MNDFINNLHNKPLHVRKQVALVVSGVLTGFITLAWFGFGDAIHMDSFSGKMVIEQEGAEVGSETEAQMASPFRAVKKEFDSMTVSLWDLFGSVEEESAKLEVVEDNEQVESTEDSL